METIFWTFQSAAVTLEISSRSPKFNQLFPYSKKCPYSKPCFCASLVKIHPLSQKIMHGNHILDISKWPYTLKIRSRSPKFDQLLPSSQQYIYASLIQLHPLVQKRLHGNHILVISKCPYDLERSLKSN